MDSQLISRIVREVVRRLSEEGATGDAPSGSVDPVRLVTEALVKEAVRDGRKFIPVSDATVVTPLARDLLKENGVELTVVGEGLRESAPQAERSQRIAIAGCPKGGERGRQLARWLEARGHRVDVVGWASAERPAWLPLVISTARRVSDGTCDMAVTVDSDGARAAIASNKLRGVRGAVCHDVGSARRARRELDANVIHLPAETVAPTLAQQILTVWLTTAFDPANRPRLDQVEGLE